MEPRRGPARDRSSATSGPAAASGCVPGAPRASAGGGTGSLPPVTDLLVIGRRPRARPAAVSRGRGRPLASLVRRHRALVLLLVAAAALRIVAVVAIYPGIWFSDSNSYIEAAATGTLSATRVDGYALVVAPFWQAGSAGALIVVQHVVGLGIVVVLYALLVHRGVSRLLALLAVVPAALDAYLIEVEHTIMSETIFHAAVVGAIALLLWKERPGLVAAVAGGLLLGYAGVVRSVAIPFIAIFVVYLLVRRVGWYPLLGFCLGCALVTAGYATVFEVQHGKFAFTESSGRFLYAKTAPFADCTKLGALPASERSLCPDPRDPLTTNEYLWGTQSPIKGLPVTADARIRDFAQRVIRHQPLRYAGVVAGGVAHYFEPGHRIGPNDYPVAAWQFPTDPRRWVYPGYRGPIRPGNPRLHRRHRLIEPSRYVGAMVTRPRLNVPASRFLHDYQRVAYTWGPLLAACLLVVALALLSRRGGGRLRLDAALLAAAALSALLVAQALSLFSYRYGLVAAILLPAAAALAWTALLEPARRAGARAAAR